MTRTVQTVTLTWMGTEWMAMEAVECGVRSQMDMRVEGEVQGMVLVIQHLMVLVGRVLGVGARRLMVLRRMGSMPGSVGQTDQKLINKDRPRWSLVLPLHHTTFSGRILVSKCA